MHRFYSQYADFSKPLFILTDSNEIHHIKDVLRLKSGDKVAVFNGKNEQAMVAIQEIKINEVVFKVVSVDKAAAKKTKIILACAVPKKAKFEFIIEKCTELGVDEIIPLHTKRAEVVFSQEKVAAKQQRFEKVAINAAKQCGRLDVPKIHPMRRFAEVVGDLDPQSVAVIPSLNGQPAHLKTVLTDLPQTASITVFIGPEGDFTPDEVALAVKAKCLPVSLGSTVLKVDTAAMTTVALCAFFLYN